MIRFAAILFHPFPLFIPVDYASYLFMNLNIGASKRCRVTER